MENKDTNKELDEQELDSITGGHANLEVSHLKPGLTEARGIRAKEVKNRPSEKWIENGGDTKI